MCTCLVHQLVSVAGDQHLAQANDKLLHLTQALVQLVMSISKSTMSPTAAVNAMFPVAAHTCLIPRDSMCHARLKHCSKQIVKLVITMSLSFFFFFFFFGRERYSLHKCNDSNLKSM